MPNLNYSHKINQTTLTHCYALTGFIIFKIYSLVYLIIKPHQ